MDYTILLDVAQPTAAKLPAPATFNDLPLILQYMVVVFGPTLTFLLGLFTLYYQNRQNKKKEESRVKAHSDDSYRKDININHLCYALRDQNKAVRCSVFMLHNGGFWFNGLKTDWNHKKKITCIYEAPDPSGMSRSVSLDFNDRLIIGPVWEWVNTLRESETGIAYLTNVDDPAVSHATKTMFGLYGAKSSVSVLLRDVAGHPLSIVTVDFAFANPLDELGVARIAAEGSRIGRLLQLPDIP